MNNLLIEKIIKANNKPCPDFTYTNPLLDKNVTKALSESLMNILKTLSQNTNVNNSLRLSVLENIRKLCIDHPQNHLNIDDNLTELLTTLYEKHLKESIQLNATETVNKDVENFLLINYKELNLKSSSGPIINPEIIQALQNLSNKEHGDLLSKSVMYWNMDDPRYIKLAKDLWKNMDYDVTNVKNTLSIKMKCDIEKILLEVSHYVLENKESDFNNVISVNKDFNNIINSCPNSHNLFQICCSIFNYIFMVSNFSLCIQKFIQEFIVKVKSLCPEKSISLLYPLHLSHVVVLLDIDINNIQMPLKESYIQITIEYLKKLHTDVETDLIMLLSHFPYWFDIYFHK